jgi:hypothetical protein
VVLKVDELSLLLLRFADVPTCHLPLLFPHFLSLSDCRYDVDGEVLKADKSVTAAAAAAAAGCFCVAPPSFLIPLRL